MRVASIRVIMLRAVVHALNRRGFRNAEIAARAGIGTEVVARLVGMGMRPSPAECERLDRFAVAELPALQPKPIAGRVRIRRGRPRLIAFAGKDRGAHRSAEPPSP